MAACLRAPAQGAAGTTETRLRAGCKAGATPVVKPLPWSSGQRSPGLFCLPTEKSVERVHKHSREKRTG